jgi:hypothetical protein
MFPGSAKRLQRFPHPFMEPINNGFRFINQSIALQVNAQVRLLNLKNMAMFPASR